MASFASGRARQKEKGKSGKKKESRVRGGLPILNGKNERKKRFARRAASYLCVPACFCRYTNDRSSGISWCCPRLSSVSAKRLPAARISIWHKRARAERVNISPRTVSVRNSRDSFSFLLFHSTDSLVLFPFGSIDFSVKIFTRRWIIDVTRCVQKYTELGSILIFTTECRLTMNHSAGEYISCVLIFNLLNFYTFNVYLSFLPEFSL